MSRPATILHANGVVAMALVMLAAGPVAAQTLYRCGNSYQDQPCSSDAGRVVGRNHASGDTATLPLDPLCAQRGEAALRIMWLRQAGATQEQQVRGLTAAGGTPPQDPQLVAQVYRLRGTPPQVRATIESDCMADLATERDLAQAAGAAAAARAARIGTVEAASLGARDAGLAAAPTPSTRAAATPPSTPDAPSVECRRLERQLTDNARSAREGGSIAYMEVLSRERRQLEQARRDARCD